jgi:hypothetical protein
MCASADERVSAHLLGKLGLASLILRPGGQVLILEAGDTSVVEFKLIWGLGLAVARRGRL